MVASVVGDAVESSKAHACRLAGGYILLMSAIDGNGTTTAGVFVSWISGI
jgi:hypothetical protein